MGLTNSKKFNNNIDSLSVDKQTSSISNTDSNDLIIYDVSSETDSVISNENQAILLSNEINTSKEQTSIIETEQQSKIKCVKFCERVMVIKSNSPLNVNRSNETHEESSSSNTVSQLTRMNIVEVFFIDLQDEKYSKDNRLSFSTRNRSRRNNKTENDRQSSDYDHLRPWRIKKENTFYGSNDKSLNA